MPTDRPSPRIVIDGVFFQIARTGIARVWTSLLEEWASNGFAAHIALLDRGGTVPQIAGIRHVPAPLYDWNHTGKDSEILQFLCDREGADLFISTFYTTPITTPSVLLAYDMVPEIFGADLSVEGRVEKHHAILHASAFAAISENTARDLRKFFPHIPPHAVTVTLCGVGRDFGPCSDEEVNAFRAAHGLTRPYFLLVGHRLGVDSYKNAALFFRAFSHLPERDQFAVVCAGGAAELEEPLRPLAEGREVHLLQLSDQELRAAYAGAVALVYPSRYEGFGLPVVEAMACGCPVITCCNSSLPEVAGNAALYVNEVNAYELLAALGKVQEPERRQAMIEAGLEQAKKFSWAKQAQELAQVFMVTTASVKDGSLTGPGPLWFRFRAAQAEYQRQIDQARVDLHQAGLELKRSQDSLGHQLYLTHQQLQQAQQTVAEMVGSPFWKLREHLLRCKAPLRRLTAWFWPAPH